MLFNELDQDKSGYLEEKEIYNAMLQLGINPTPEDLKTIISKYDTNRDGRIGLDEF